MPTPAKLHKIEVGTSTSLQWEMLQLVVVVNEVCY